MFGHIGRMLVVVPIVAAGLAFGSVRPAEAAFTCTTSYANRVIKTSIIVPAGGECALDSVLVRGGITIRPGGDLDVDSSEIRGNVSASGAEDVEIDFSVVRGNISISNSADEADIQFSDVYGNVSITDSEDGDVYENNIYGTLVFTDVGGDPTFIYGNYVKINLVCDDVPQGVDSISNNTVDGQVIVSNCPEADFGE